MPVWRVGHYFAPCDFSPHHLYGWSNRFDDLNRKYRTLYCADKKKTCLREVLADFRPNVKAINEFRSKLNQIGMTIPLNEDIPELRAVCLEFGLKLG